MSTIKLKVLIVGGGIAGLTVALALRKQGHAVTVVESSSWLQETGAAVGVPPNATRVLTDLGIDLKQNVKAAVLQSTKEYYFAGADRPPKFGENGDGKHVPWVRRLKDLGLQNYFLMAHRVDLHDTIKNKRMSPEGAGTPVKVTLASKVVEWDVDGSIKLHDGKRMHADLIIAADGIHSTAHEAILGRKVPVKPSGITAMRFILKTTDITDDPETASFMDDGPGCFAFYSNVDRRSYLLRYPCHNNEMQTFGAYAYTGDTETLAGEQVSRAALLQRLSFLPPIIQAIGNKSGDYTGDWKIADREPIQTYYKDRLVLIRDAAHSMWPRQGQGAAQSIEDAATLGILLSGLKDKSQISKRLELYDQLRVRRTSIIQLLSRTREIVSRANGLGTDSGDPLPEEVLSIFRKLSPDFRPSNYGQLSKLALGI